MALDSASLPAEAVGHIDDITDGLAQVTVNGAEWFYPIEMLPDDARAGDEIDVELVDGKYQPVEIDEHDPFGSIDRRLNRKINSRRTAQIEAKALRKSLEG